MNDGPIWLTGIVIVSLLVGAWLFAIAKLSGGGDE
jgi:hypothetical protein